MLLLLDFKQLGFDRQLPDVLFIHLLPNFLVAGCEIEPKGCLDMVLLVRNEIIFVYFTGFFCFNIATAECSISSGRWQD